MQDYIKHYMFIYTHIYTKLYIQNIGLYFVLAYLNSEHVLYTETTSQVRSQEILSH